MKTQVQREKENGLQRLTIVLDKVTFRELKILAAKKGTSMTDLARVAIVRYLRDKESQ